MTTELHSSLPGNCIRIDHPIACGLTNTRRSDDRPKLTDSVEKVASAAACRSSVPAVEVAASH
ncbi:hypothetical protein, partial [Ectopseudomonas oleovorans]|uniref:hypothetical protein n=1 Tax=Ectopseudomonas oleovorans TaxID=301 RepID=UPI001C8CCB2A